MMPRLRSALEVGREARVAKPPVVATAHRPLTPRAVRICLGKLKAGA